MHVIKASTNSELPPLPAHERLVELMMDAARGGRDDMILPLLQAGVAIDARDAKGYTPLILASYHGHETTTNLILTQGASVDLVDGARGNTALMGVCFKGYDAIAHRLIVAGADVNARNRAGQTALMMAALFGHDSIVDLLLSNSADASIDDCAGNTATSVAMAQGNSRLATTITARVGNPDSRLQ